LTAPPDQAQLPTLGAPLENFHHKRDTTGTVARTDPVKNPSPGGHGPSETVFDRRD
jgi:hypothetical protein